MNRQQQISSKIIQTKHEIDQVDLQIQRETQKQKLLDELMMELDFSSCDESQIQRMINSRNQSEASLDQSNAKSRLSNFNKSVGQNQSQSIEENSSFITEDLSFEIEKIKLFQKDKLHLLKPQPQFTEKNRFKLNEFNFNLEILQQNIPNQTKQARSEEDELKSISNRGNNLNQNNFTKFGSFYKPYRKVKQRQLIDRKIQPSSSMKDSPKTGEFYVRPTNLIQKTIQRQNQRVSMRTKMIIESQQNERKRLQMMDEQKSLIREEILKQKKLKRQNLVEKVYADNQTKGKLKFDAKFVKIKSTSFKQNEEMLSNLQSNRRKIFSGDEGIIEKLSNTTSKDVEDSYCKKFGLNSTLFIDSSFGNKAVNKYSRYIEKSISSLSKTQSRISSFKQQLKTTKKKYKCLF